MRTASTRTALMLTLVLSGALVGGAQPLAARATDSLRLVNVNLGRGGGTPSPGRYAQLRSLLLYMEADILVVHSVRGSTGGRAGPVQHLARSLDMYCAYLSPSPDSQLGSAVLSPHRLADALAVVFEDRRPELITAGAIRAHAGADLLSLLVVNAGEPSDGTEMAEAVADAVEGLAALIEENSDERFVAFASFESEALAQAALAGLEQAGLVDPLGASGRKAFTFPVAQPAQRLDFILISANLERAGSRVRVLDARAIGRVSEHLPVEVMLDYSPAG